DFRAALVTELIANRFELVADDRRDAAGGGEDLEQVDDLLHDVAIFAGDLVLLQPGKPLQPELENGLRLRIGELVSLRAGVGLPSESGRQTLGPRGIGSGALEHL